MKILCVSYRDWAKQIYKMLMSDFCEYSFTFINSKDAYSDKLVEEINPDLILWYGWSWLIPDKIFKNYPSVMLHPSPLPKYKGGSPIQNQIINGEKTSAVTLFVVDSSMDGGEIINQEPFSLEGDLRDVFDRIIKTGYKLSYDMLKKLPVINSSAQKGASTYFKRRKREQSEITLEEISRNTAEQLHNKIRCLQDPYPNAFIKCKNGEKLYIIRSKYEKNR